MARTITEIQTSIETDFTNAFPEASTSNFSDWKILISIFVTAIWAFENILDLFKTQIEATVYEKQTGTLGWYKDKFKEFQGEDDENGTFVGDPLIVKSNGVLGYETTDPSKQIISQLTTSENNGTLIAKVAQNLDDSNYKKLDDDQKLAFEIYVDNIHIPGTEIEVITQDPDLIKYDFIVYYDPLFSIATVEANVLAALDNFRQDPDIEDKIYKQKLFEKVIEAEGVVSMVPTALSAKSETDENFSEIESAVYEVEAGYFNFDEDSSLTLTSYKTLI